MQNTDILGDKGREILDACVRVKILGELETMKYDFGTAINQLICCHASQYLGDSWLFLRTWLNMTVEVFPVCSQ